jgi:hypothetical protein
VGHRARLPGVATLALATTIALAPAAAAQEETALTPAEAQRLTNSLCRAAQGLRSEEVESAIARLTYARALRTGARDTSCAAEGLAALDAAADSPQEQATTLLNQAEALAAAGYEDEAQAKVREALTAYPDAAVPDELAKPERQPTWMREAIGDAGQWVVTGALLAGVLAVALALLYGIGRVAHAHLKRRIAVQDFAGGPEGAAPAHVAALRQYSEALNNAHGAGRLDRAAGANDKLSAASNIGVLSMQAGAVTELVATVSRMLPGRTWHLTGDLLPHEPERGVGLALMISRQPSGKVISTALIRQSDFLAEAPAAQQPEDDRAVAWQRLALPAAAFVLYEDRRHFRQRKEYEKLGTESWRSFAMTVSAGAFYYWELDVARRLYRQALALDGDYKDARFDLGVAELRAAAGDADKLAQVADRFDQLAGSEGVNPDAEPLWYRARLWQTVAQLSNDDVQAAASTALNLFDPQSTKWWVEDDKKLPSTLKPLLGTMRPVALVVLATALERADGHAQGELAGHLRNALGIQDAGDVSGRGIVQAMTGNPSLRAVAAYNLACFHARLARDPWRAEALTLLREALARGGPQVARWAWSDHGLANLKAQAAADFRTEVESAGYTPP